ncbi:MAG: thiol-disulfide isomerase/thioredoxin [Bacteroidia bacterium]|jgi:thiol-disulfide isomerase/thioredoxin
MILSKLPKYLAVPAICIFGALSSFAQNKTQPTYPTELRIDSSGLNIPVYQSEPFLKLLNNLPSDTLYVINFWATWCKPCVEELPVFEVLTDSFQQIKLKVLLVSLDMKSSWDSTLTKFIKRSHIQSEVIILHEPNADLWINQINPTWDGAIPITLFKKGDTTLFKEGKLNFDQIKTIILQIN